MRYYGVSETVDPIGARANGAKRLAVASQAGAALRRFFEPARIFDAPCSNWVSHAKAKRADKSLPFLLWSG